MPTSMATAGFIQALTRERLLLCCLLASIALHALVLLGMPRYELPAPASKTLLALTARLAPFAAAAQASVQAPQTEPAPPRVAQPAPAPRPALTKPLASPAPAAQKTEPTAPASSAPESPVAADSTVQARAPVLARAVPQTPAGIPGAGAGAKAGNEADAGTLEQYRMALIVATRRYKRYPAIAMEKGWQGRVEVHMVIGANGMLASASIKSGSGHEILDKQALDMLSKGKDTVPIPASLRGREFNIDVPVIFNLDNPPSWEAVSR